MAKKTVYVEGRGSAHLDKISKMSSREEKLEAVLLAALVHGVANLGGGYLDPTNKRMPVSEFYSCYTYGVGRMPAWVREAKKLLGRWP